MVCRFRVLRYYPDLVTGECINVGLVAFDGERVTTRVRPNWDRVTRFGGRLEQSIVEAYLDPLHDWTPEQASAYEAHYMSSLQFGEMGASTQSIEECADDMANVMFREPAS